MYAIAPLAPADAPRFRSLTPYELRPVLADLAGLPRVRAFGATLRGRPVGLALAVQGWGAPGLDGGAIPPATAARVLSLTVARGHRRLGIGQALLHALEVALAADGVQHVSATSAIPVAEGRIAADRLFARAGWDPPEVVMVQCRADEALLDAPLMRAQRDVPAGYEIVDWVDLSGADRASIRARQADAPWFPDSLNPFHHEAELEIQNSLALRYHGDVVGWLITFRTGPTTLYYRCMFVREDLARLGRALTLLCEAIRRHAALIAPARGYGEWSTPAAMPSMLRFIRRHLEPFGATVLEQRCVRKTLPIVDGNSAQAVRAPRRAPATVPALSAAECAAALEQVHALRAHWQAREETLPFYTIGALARLDALEDHAAYARRAAAERDLLTRTFGWVYARIASALTRALGAPIALHPIWASPPIHIRTPTRGAALPITAVHCDLEPSLLRLSTADQPVGGPTLSFSVLISDADDGAGLRLWDLAHQETIGLDSEERARLLQVTPEEVVELRPGQLLIHDAQTYHQLTPLRDATATLPRVTLEGHAVLEDGVWQIFE